MTSWRKLNTNLVHFWAPKPEYRLFLVPVCILAVTGAYISLRAKITSVFP